MKENEPIQEEEKKESKKYCTLFLKKKNKPVITFWVHTLDEKTLKYICILKGYTGKLKPKIFDNIQEYLTNGVELSEGSEKELEKFNKLYRILVKEN